MLKFIAPVVAALLAFTPLETANASNSNDYGSISGIYGVIGGAVIFSVVTSGRSSLPSCATTGPARWVLDASTVAGQASVAVLLSAWAARKRIWVNGLGTCTVWSDTETVLYFNIED